MCANGFLCIHSPPSYLATSNQPLEDHIKYTKPDNFSSKLLLSYLLSDSTLFHFMHLQHHSLCAGVACFKPTFQTVCNRY